jgi:acetyl-CoA carboxylase beta subunit
MRWKDYAFTSDLYSKDTINKTRVENKMDIIKDGYRNCLQCDRQFFSKDIKIFRICSGCKQHKRFELVRA